MIYADFSRAGDTDQLPEGYQQIDELIAEDERDPVRRAAIEAGRKLVAQRYYGDTVGLAALRLRRGWSQRNLADAIGVKQPHIARLESGHHDPSLGTVRKLAEALQATVDEIVRAFPARQ